MHWHSRSIRNVSVLQVIHFPYQSSLEDPGNIPEFLQVSLRKQRKDWWKALQQDPTKCKVVLTRGQVMYTLKFLDILGLELRNLALKSAFLSLGTVGKCIVKVCLSQAFMCNTETNFLLCFYCICSSCTVRQYQLCTFMYSQIRSVQITLQLNHSVGTCTKHY